MKKQLICLWILAPLIISSKVTDETANVKTKDQTLTKLDAGVAPILKNAAIDLALGKLHEKENEKNHSTGKAKTTEEKDTDTRNALDLPPSHPVPSSKNPVVVIKSGKFKGKEIVYISPRESVWHEYFWACYEAGISIPLIFFGHVGWPWLKTPTGFLMGFAVTQFAEYPMMKIFVFGEQHKILWFCFEIVMCITFALFYQFFARFAWLWTGMWTAAFAGRSVYFLTVWIYGLNQEMQFTSMYWLVLFLFGIFGSWAGRFMGQKFLIVGTPFLGAMSLVHAVGELTDIWPSDPKNYNRLAFHEARVLHLILFMALWSISLFGFIFQKIHDNKLTLLSPDQNLKLDMNQTGVASDISEIKKKWYHQFKDTARNMGRALAGKNSLADEEAQKAYDEKRKLKGEIKVDSKI